MFDFDDMDFGMDVLGVEPGSFDIASIFSAAGEVVQRGVDYAKQKKAGEEAGRSAGAQLQAVLAADRAAVDATARALLSAEDAQASAGNAAKNPAARPLADRDAARTAADAASLQVALAAQQVAAAGLAPDGAAKRIAAVQQRVSDAAAELRAHPGDRARAALLKAAQALLGSLTGASPSQISDAPLAVYEPPPQSFLTRKIGPIPVWGAALLGVGGLLAWRKWG